MRGVLLVSCFAVACAHGPRPPPLTGWQEVRSEHFRLRTDLAPWAARLTLRRLETLRAALQSAWLVPGDTADTADVVVLEDTTELLTFTDWLGLSTVSGARPLLVTAGVLTSPFQDDLPYLPYTPVLAHELTHVLARWRMPSAAPWFEEGLAGLFGSVEIQDGRLALLGHEVSLPSSSRGDLAGRPPYAPSGAEPSGPPEGGLVETGWALSLDELERLPWQFQTPDAARTAYHSARLWVQALRLRERGRVVALETALRGGSPWRSAWAEARRGLGVGELQDLVRRWAAGARPPLEEHPFSAPEVHSTERGMASWEVHLVLADLWTLGGSPEQRSEHFRRARAELESAVREEPGEALPRVRLAELEPDPEARLALAERIAGAHPDSGDAAVFLAATLRDDPAERPGRGQAVARAIALAPEDPDALTASAVEQARTGQVAAALQTAGRAVALAPWSPVVYRVQANLLAAVGRCQEALEAAHRARAVLPHRAPPELVEALHRDETLIGRRCAPHGAPVH